MMDGQISMETYTLPYVKQIASENLLYVKFVLYDNLEGWEVGGRFKMEGVYVYLWLIHVDVWQKPRQYCKVIILQ